MPDIRIDFFNWHDDTIQLTHFGLIMSKLYVRNFKALYYVMKTPPIYLHFEIGCP